MDLEQEFQKLMDEAIKSIAEKRKKGELSSEEASDLVDIVSTRRQKGARAWSYSSDCYTDELDESDYSSDDSPGWQRSSWCEDNG
jgi:hypothetical protein